MELLNTRAEADVQQRIRSHWSSYHGWGFILELLHHGHGLENTALALSLSLSLTHTHIHTQTSTHSFRYVTTSIHTLQSLVYPLTHSISLFSFCFSCLRVVNDDVYCTLRSTDETESKHSDKRLVQIFGQCICDVYKAFLRLRRGDGQWFLLLDLLIWRSLLMVFAYSNKVWGKMCLV